MENKDTEPARADQKPQFQSNKFERPNYTYWDSFRHWWHGSSLQKSEEEVLSLLPFYPDSEGTRVAEILDVPIDDKNKLHEFNIRNIQPHDRNEEDHVVLVHGYGAALGFFYKNFESLTERSGINLHALDLLGYGLSSRPSLPKTSSKNTKEDIEKLEAFFIESIESWRESRHIDNFYLIGHSLGGYLCSLYALKYPEHVKKVVLVSPVGVEKSIYDLTGINRSTDEFKTGPDIEQEVSVHNEEPDATIKTSSSLHVPDADGYVKRLPNFPKYLVYLWEKNVSPFTLLRVAGPWGPQFTSRWSFRRFSSVANTAEMMKLHVYSHNTFVAKGSGEYALTRLLAPGALARYPLLARVPQNLKVDSLWIYGDVDWMSKEAGKTISEAINKQGKVKADYEVLSGAGHHVYLDNPAAFKKSVYRFFGW